MRVLSRVLVCALTVATGLALASVPAPASAAPATAAPAAPSRPGATGLHSGMMPASSPDARTTAGATGQLQTAGPALPTGIDVSGHQHANGATISWSQVAASGQKFAVVKATELYTDDTTGLPVLYTNPYLQTDLAAAHAAGLVVGSYSYVHPENSAVAQADDFASAIGTLPAGSLPPVMDLEETGGLTPSQLVAWAHAFLNELQTRTGVLPMIYAGPNFWTTALGGNTGFAQYPLWEAHYTSLAAPYQMGGWSTYTLWQYTSSATIPGISGAMDQDRFNSATGATLSNLHLPVGSFESATADGTGLVTARGWAIDPDVPSSAATVEVFVDGVLQTLTANGYRPDVAATYPLAGSSHGFSATAHAGPGAHTVCVNAVDLTSAGRRTGFGCKTVTVTPRYPTGSFESLRADGTGRLTMSGWAIDPDTPTTPVRVNVYVDGHGVAGVMANGSRPDIGALYPSAGSLHGFTATAQTGPGAHTVCVYVVDTSFPSRIPRLACRTVTVTPRYPYGSFEAASVDGTGRLTVRGWTIDPDTPTTPVRVNVYVDGRGVVALTANVSRPDVGAAYPTAGSLHGFTGSAQVTAGPHTVCVYAVDTSFPSRIPRLGCRTVG
jgi:GH25 family lysozyme M1 (1,4-beta-N-acetylmuramidase)